MFSSQRALTFAKKATLTFVSQSSIATFASTFFSSKFFSQPYAQAFAQAQAITTSFSLAQLRQQPNSHANCRAAGNDYASRANSCSSHSSLNFQFANESKRERKSTCNETGQTIATWHDPPNKIRTCMPCRFNVCHECNKIFYLSILFTNLSHYKFATNRLRLEIPKA